jgi:hypothetical protein
LAKAREWGVTGRDEAGLEWVASLRAADDVAGLLRGRVGGLVPALVRHFCPASAPGTTTATATKAKTAPALYRLVVSSPAFAHVLRSPNAASPSALPTHAKHSLALLLYTLYRYMSPCESHVRPHTHNRTTAHTHTHTQQPHTHADDVSTQAWWPGGE